MSQYPRRSSGRLFPVRSFPAALALLVAGCVFVLACPRAQADGGQCSGAASALVANGASLADLDKNADRQIEILAIGSSSTEGIGASSPANAYPARLESELSHEDGIAAKVENAGIGGELAVKTLQRLKTALKIGWAELVIWQVGTNDAMVGVDEALFRATLESGVAAAKAAHVPLVLIDPQFTAKNPDQARYERFVGIVDDVGARDRVPVLERFGMMKRSGRKSAMGLLSSDGLHMNDAGYRCLAHVLAEAIERAAGAKL